MSEANVVSNFLKDFFLKYKNCTYSFAGGTNTAIIPLDNNTNSDDLLKNINSLLNKNLISYLSERDLDSKTVNRTIVYESVIKNDNLIITWI